MKKTPEIVFDNAISQKTKMMWRSIIYAGYSCMLDLEKNSLPPLFIYNTMVQCLYSTFDYSHPMVDKMSDRFSRDKVWAFAYLQNPEIRNKKTIEFNNFQRIVIASSRTEMTPDLSPEMVVFHEMGHFILFNMLNVPLTENSLQEVEQKCNDYAIQLYVRLILMFPNYTTKSIDNEVIKFENSIKRKCVNFGKIENPINAFEAYKEVMG